MSKKISELSPITNIEGTEQFPIVQSNVSKKATWNTLKKVPMFSAYPSANLSVSANTWTKVLFNRVEYDNFNYFDTSNNRYLPLRAGYYFIEGHTQFYQEPGGPTNIYISLRKNSNQFRWFSNLINYNAAYNQGMHVSSIIYLNGSTDYLEIWVHSGASYASTIYSSVASTWFNGYFLRPT